MAIGTAAGYDVQAGIPISINVSAHVVRVRTGASWTAFHLLCFGRESEVVLYFDMYHKGSSALVPEGLSFEAVG